jgi:hypothetical protein
LQAIKSAWIQAASLAKRTVLEPPWQGRSFARPVVPLIYIIVKFFDAMKILS